MTKEELEMILEKHEKWLKGMKGGSRADLRRADLRRADLRGADLRGVNLRGVNLRRADLRRADLRGADFCEADLRGADFCGADLRGADFCEADLHIADFCEADLHGASLSGADFYNANFYEAKNIPFIPLFCPSDGAFVGWKKVEDKLIKLQIPEDAKRCSATTEKCRCDKAFVLGIYNLDGIESNLTEILNTNKTNLLYKVGEMVYPDSYDEDRWNECSHGIHFFINKENAILY